MFVPALPAPPAAPLTPSGIASAPISLTAPAHTQVTVRSSQLDVLDGGQATVAGALLDEHRDGLGLRIVVLQAFRGHGWQTVTRVRTDTRGRYTLRYTPPQMVSETVRVRFVGDSTALPARRRAGTLTVYKLAGASWYGGGGGLACGGTLTSSTLGVANKTLPCGTLVTLRYNGRSVSVPVIDRGPYVEGREFDLTEATKRALGFGDVGQVWSTR